MLPRLIVPVAVAAVLFVARPARADDAPEDPTKEWPVHLDPPPPALSHGGLVGGAPEATATSDDDLWKRKLHRHHVDGALGFAGAYGAAAALGGIFTGLVLSHDAKNPGSDSSAALKWVAVPLFTPVIGPIFLGGAVAIGYTAILFTAGSGTGESGGGAYVALTIMFAPVAYGFSALATADGIMQGVLLKQAFGWSDPARPSSLATRMHPMIGRTLRSVTPMIVSEVQAPAWVSASAARGLPSAVGLQLPVSW